MSANDARRPIGASVLAFALGWLAFAGFGNAVVWRTAGRSLVVPEESPLARFIVAASSPFAAILMIAYGVTAAIACVGVWRMRPWMPRAIVAWAIVVVSVFVWLFAVTPPELVAGGWAVSGAFLLGVMGLLGLIYAYVRGLARKHSRAAL